MASARARLQAWWASRLPRTDTLTLTQRNVYILPTRAGWMFALTLLVLLLASINYQLSLGYVLTFLLAGSGVVSMHLTHGTLRGLELHLKPPAPAHAGEALSLVLHLSSPASARHGVGLRLQSATDASDVWIDVPEQSEAQARLQLHFEARGRHALPMLRIHTRFPLGLFQAWALWRPHSEALIYPKAEHPEPPLPLGAAATEQAKAPPIASGAEQLDGVRAYRAGDPQRLIAWKASAKSLASSGQWMSRDAQALPQSPDTWLEWQATEGLGVEARLSRLCAWVLAHESQGQPYGLRLPGQIIGVELGAAQRHRCLEALALWSAKS